MNIDFKKYKNDLIFLPIGGSSEIGLNCNLYHFNGKWIIVEMGIGFVKHLPGIDISVPNIDFIKTIKKDILGIIVTHAHEDHIGAIPYLWEELELPIFTSPFAADFLREKLSGYRFAKQVQIHEIDPTKELKIGPFSLEFIGLTHSIPEMNAVLIKTENGSILHTGDWKFDGNPVIGKTSDVNRLKELGKNRQILATVSDSTNIFKEGHSSSEGDLFDSLTGIIKKKNGMVIISMFASNVARLKTLVNVAKKCNRKVILAGSSLLRIAKVARKSSYLNETDFINESEFNKYKRHEILVIATGCQGERNASMNKIANNDHKFIKANKDDTIIFSSKIIPGNEKDLFAIYNKFAEREIEVITEKNDLVHVSGHYTRDELKEMYALTKPKVAIAVHGEASHILEHSKLAKECGIQYPLKAKDGEIVIISENGYEKIGNVPSEFIAVDGTKLISVNSPILKARRKIAENGAVFVSLVMDKKYNLLCRPTIMAPGAYDAIVDPELTEILEDDIVDEIRNSIRDFGFAKKGNKEHINQRFQSILEANIHKAINGIFKQENDKKPVIKVAFNLID